MQDNTKICLIFKDMFEKILDDYGVNTFSSLKQNKFRTFLFSIFLKKLKDHYRRNDITFMNHSKNLCYNTLFYFGFNVINHLSYRNFLSEDEEEIENDLNNKINMFFIRIDENLNNPEAQNEPFPPLETVKNTSVYIYDDLYANIN